GASPRNPLPRHGRGILWDAAAGGVARVRPRTGALARRPPVPGSDPWYGQEGIARIVASGGLEELGMRVRDGMSRLVLTVGPGHTLRDAARLMRERGIGSAVVLDPEQPGPGILTERDVLTSVGAGEDPDTER